MKRAMWWTLGVLALAAVGARAEDAFLKEFKANALRVTESSFGWLKDPRIRNRHYSVELIRKEVQRKLSGEWKAIARSPGAGDPKVRELVLKETKDLVEELSQEVARLAKDNPDSGDMGASLSRISDQLGAWADPAGKGSPVQVTGGPAGTKQGADALQPTEDNIEGPFYRPGAPFTNSLAAAGEAGDALVLSGRVLGTDGSPLPGALLDFWQANAKGEYDIADPADRNNPAIPLKLRGRLRADGEGRFRLTTIAPGQYEIGGGRWRPKHIHVKVSAPGRRFLTTQLYFDGDQFNAVDPWWKPSLNLRPAADGNGGAASFEFVLPATGSR